ncbi:undecaprenyldiphospho-muramoylpentapeptide beta-N-acetylglucosaminyltransferase [Nitrosomonas sp. JL21]|uniref:undecaprenyldiphospho-muramoylpentapeptide beta-N-acetylglucosaminyltransferase n=1 Tax=Nitrosomonas sp. JL21 TaxID=153949 RepID=UPI001370B963|nr:undecaprenyldiphospho-muramoylpentapeptide beta-N-acetylglucosaminyltransferase [Nitrosomonas sp. JL21]MBL8497156.1 undecaprenyldiphospho-muramoylpentapeptide beta-N-acetylglucosaminyltransferase [Nitrosomonas sp.]MCC7092266.1 undecaprenyldiphospho-muramoylpentapeptide beta-N-acetylglucosaminyltransferase [Nitrosomonas sp.]MXS76626.1 undecaprenyldiphospho-muramoylpentapeptide beta-N-acetylglucosaminyltransferase [Nitrosomonas sp. JL21]
MKSRTILIMAGGTGGHVFPGLAVADHLQRAGWHIVWLGTEHGMEMKLVPRYGYEVEAINFSGLRGKRLMAWLWLPLRLIRAFMQSLTIIRRVSPDVVLGMGGYPAFPGGIMASLLNKPLIIHEQNSLPGLTNRLLAKLADKIMLGFPNAIHADPKRTVFSGNPVRAEIAQIAPPQQRFPGREGRLSILVIGGSLGAQILNTVVPEALVLMAEQHRPVIVHQVGALHLETARQRYADLRVQGEVLAFIENMAERYAACDLVLCRAGALTIAELSAAGVASILVPYPHAVDDHQTSNAQFLANAGAAILVPQQEFTAQKLTELLMHLTRDKLLNMAMMARSLAKPDAAAIVAEACVELSGATA